MTNRLCNLGLAAGILLIGAPAFAQEAAPVPGRGAIELGLRLGVGFPLGNEGQTAGDTTNSKLSNDLKAIIPLQLDAGYRINPNVYVGLFFQYGFGIVNTDTSTNPICGQSGVSCSGSDVRLGANVHYHLSPTQYFDPWVGLGAGYEWLTLTVSGGGMEANATATGFEFGNLQLGGDIHVAPNFGIGPFVSVSFGQYGNISVSGNGMSTDMAITSKSLHEWLEFGVRGVFDIGL